MRCLGPALWLALLGCAPVAEQVANSLPELLIDGPGLPYNSGGAVISAQPLSFSVAIDSPQAAPFLTLNSKLGESADSPPQPYSGVWELYGPQGSALEAGDYLDGKLPNKLNPTAKEPVFLATLATSLSAGTYRVELSFQQQGQATGVRLTRSFPLLAFPQLSSQLTLDARVRCLADANKPEAPKQSDPSSSTEPVTLVARTTAQLEVKTPQSACVVKPTGFSIGFFRFRNLPDWVSSVVYDQSSATNVSLTAHYLSAASLYPLSLRDQSFPVQRNQEGEVLLEQLVYVHTIAAILTHRSQLKLLDRYGQALPLSLVFGIFP